MATKRSGQTGGQHASQIAILRSDARTHGFSLDLSWMDLNGTKHERFPPTPVLSGRAEHKGKQSFKKNHFGGGACYICHLGILSSISGISVTFPIFTFHNLIHHEDINRRARPICSLQEEEKMEQQRQKRTRRQRRENSEIFSDSLQLLH